MDFTGFFTNFKLRLECQQVFSKSQFISSTMMKRFEICNSYLHVMVCNRVLATGKTLKIMVLVSTEVEGNNKLLKIILIFICQL